MLDLFASSSIPSIIKFPLYFVFSRIQIDWYIFNTYIDMQYVMQWLNTDKE